MPRTLPASPQMSVEQIEAHLKKELENYKHIEFTGAYKYPKFTAQEMYIKIQEANANLVALNLDRGIICIHPYEERLIAAAEESLAFLKDNFLCEKTQQSLSKQLGIYYAYYKGWIDHARTKMVIFMDCSNDNRNTLEYAQGFLYLAYTYALEENFHEESHLQLAIEVLDALAKITPISIPEVTSILVEKGHATFLLGLFNYRKSYLLNENVDDKAAHLKKAAEFLQKAIDCQTEALSKIEDNIELTTQVMLELTSSHRLACVIYYKMNDTAKTVEALKNSQEVETKVVSNVRTIQANGCSVREANIPDAKVKQEFSNIYISATLNTGSSPADAGMFSESRQFVTFEPPPPIHLRPPPNPKYQ